MKSIKLGNRSFEVPVFVPSVSSFETQLPPQDALRLQFFLREPISLVSAYDIHRDEGPLKELCKNFRDENGVILLDSGGYESSRISRYSDEQKIERWDFNKYSIISNKNDLYDFIFSFDYFLTESENAKQYSDRLLKELFNHSEFMDIFKLVPVIHIQTEDGKHRLTEQDALTIFQNVVSELDCRFVAIPERELGDGIIARAELTRKIASTISEHTRAPECSLHILGCGNLLSFSVLAVSGAAMCDGLEWCRTFAADNFHLHHFQQMGIFADTRHHIGNPAAEFIVNNAEVEYPVSVAVKNLLGFQAFTRSLHRQMSAKTVHEFVGENFGDVARDAVRALEI